jgi:thiamine pyrophosphate-dependent acetolactate synthase large subunit-like protein
MPIVAVFQTNGFTQEVYEETVRRLTGGGHLESPADWPVEGLLAHAAGQGGDGFRVVDVWESEEAFARFGETLLPMLADLGIEGEPDIYPAHTYVSA